MILRPVGKSLDVHYVVVGPRKCYSIKMLGSLGEAYLLGCGHRIGTLVETLSVYGNVRLGNRAFAEYVPRPGLVDALAVHGHPITYAVYDLLLLLVKCAVGTKRNAQ